MCTSDSRMKRRRKRRHTRVKNKKNGAGAQLFGGSRLELELGVYAALNSFLLRLCLLSCHLLPGGLSRRDEDGFEIFPARYSRCGCQ